MQWLGQAADNSRYCSFDTESAEECGSHLAGSQLFQIYFKISTPAARAGTMSRRS